MQGARLKRKGVKKGVPDILIFERIKDAPGAAIELKVGSGKQTPEQKQWQEDLMKRGWKFLCSNDLDEVLEFINAIVTIQREHTAWVLSHKARSNQLGKGVE